MMKKRESQKTLATLAKTFPAVVITGPRQSGKTTLAREHFPGKPYFSLENPDTRRHAQEDPRDFLAQCREGAILDEIQNCPHLLSYLQEELDARRTMGRFVLTGSRQFALMENLSQSLAGRVGLLTLLPFTWAECYEKKIPPLEEMLFTGLFPPVHDRKVVPHHWYAGYVQTYLERDVRQQLQVHDLSAFQRFIRLCAGRTGQILNFSQLAADTGVTHNTAHAWMSVLEAACIVFRLAPFYENFNKRVMKTHKLFFCDTGLVCWLLGIESAQQLASHSMRGAIFENAVFVEKLKRRLNLGQVSNLFYWRDQSGLEIDLVEVRPNGLAPIEVKSGKTYSTDWKCSILKWRGYAKKPTLPGEIIFGGSQIRRDGDMVAIPWKKL